MEGVLTTSAERIVRGRTDWRSILRRWIWRSYALSLWLWVISKLVLTADQFSILAGLRSQPWTVAAASYVAFVALNLLLRSKWLNGCAAAVLGFPPYVLVFPIWASLLAIYYGSVSARWTVRHSQDWHVVLLAYGLTGILFVALTRTPTHGVLVASLVGVGVVLVFVGLSLATWTLRPFHWLQASLRWLVPKMQAWYDRRYGEKTREFASDPSGRAQKLKETVGHLKTARDFFRSIRKAFENPRSYDALLVVGFSRKFFISLLHVSLLFGIAHYVVATGKVTQGEHYAGLVTNGFASDWFTYTYFGFSTLITGDTGIVALSFASQLTVILNAMAGICFLILLVTTFSMLTRERVVKSVEELSRLARDAEARVEWRVLELVNLGSTHRAWTREARAELCKIGRLTVLPSDEVSVRVFNGSVMVQNVLTRLAETRSIDVLTLLRAIENLEEGQQSALYAGMGALELDDDQVVEMLRAFLNEHSGNAGSAEEPPAPSHGPHSG